MRHGYPGHFRQQVSFLRRQLLQTDGLPYTTVLSEVAIASALESIEGLWMDQDFFPLVTLWVFLGQVMSSDHSCRAAVARLIAHRISQGQPVCFAKTGAYCQARKPLPENFFSALACFIGCQLAAEVDGRWLWKGRRIDMDDGTTVMMVDTKED